MEQLHIPDLSRPPRREFEEIKSYAPRRGGGVNCITLSVGSLGRPAREELSRGFLYANPCALLNVRCGGPIGREARLALGRARASGTWLLRRADASPRMR